MFSSMEFLLQINPNQPIINPASSVAVTFFFVIIVVVIIFMIISGARGARAGSASSRTKPGSYSKRIFRKRAKQTGLSKPHIRSLEFLIKKYKTNNPYGLLRNSKSLDNLLAQAMIDIDAQVASEVAREAQKLSLFNIKQIIERNSQRKKVFTTTHQLAMNQTLILVPENGGRFQSRVTANMRNMLGVQMPLNGKGEVVRIKKWTNLTVYFWKSSGEGYSFKTKVRGNNPIKGISSLLLQHTSAIVRAQQRQFRRKDFHKPVYFLQVQVITTGKGKNTRKRAIIDQKRNFLGKFIEISAGGCSIRASTPLAPGQLIRMNFDTDDGLPVQVFGKVKGVQKNMPGGGTMHIMFTRISKTNLNRINSFVYDFS